MRGECGEVPVSFLAFVLLAGAGVYVGCIYVPVYLTEFRVENEAKGLANKALVTNLDEERLLEQFVATVERRTGLEIRPQEVDLLRDEDAERVGVVVEYDIPVEYPFLESDEWKHVICEVEVTRSRAY